MGDCKLSELSVRLKALKEKNDELVEEEKALRAGELIIAKSEENLTRLQNFLQDQRVALVKRRMAYGVAIENVANGFAEIREEAANHAEEIAADREQQDADLAALNKDLARCDKPEKKK